MVSLVIKSAILPFYYSPDCGCASASHLFSDLQKIFFFFHLHEHNKYILGDIIEDKHKQQFLMLLRLRPKKVSIQHLHGYNLFSVRRSLCLVDVKEEKEKDKKRMPHRWESSVVRSTFINYFMQQKGHVFHPSSPVVPQDDPSLLFANAGMNQYKPLFLGTPLAPSSPLATLSRAVNSQK
jgi:hypothetical protein